jgi:PAS domain S-box-containing protein
MRRLYEVNVSLAGSPPFEAALDEILSAAMVFTGTDRGHIQLVTPDGEHAEIARAFGFPPESGFLDLFRARRSQLGCAAFGRDRQRIIVEDVSTFAGLADTEEGALWRACGVLAAQSTPLISRQGEYVGVLSTQFRQPHRPSEDELKMIDLLAWTAAEFITRHRADEALRTSEERFRSFADASSDVLWIVDAQTRHLEYLSPAYEQVWGQPRETVMRDMSHWISRLHPEDAEAAGEGIERLLSGESYSTEYRIVRPDGAVRFIHDTGFPIYQDGRIVRVAGVAQDLTERRLAERALAASELRLRSLVEGLPQLVWRAAGNGSWTWASPQWTAFTGQAEPACHGEGWLESLHPDDRGAAASAWKPLEVPANSSWSVASAGPRTASIAGSRRRRCRCEMRRAQSPSGSARPPTFTIFVSCIIISKSCSVSSSTGSATRLASYARSRGAARRPRPTRTSSPPTFRAGSARFRGFRPRSRARLPGASISPRSSRTSWSPMPRAKAKRSAWSARLSSSSPARPKASASRSTNW